MYLVYMGESGDTGSSANDPAQQDLVYAGLVVHETQYIAMNGEYDALHRRHFGCRRSVTMGLTVIFLIASTDGLSMAEPPALLKKIAAVSASDPAGWRDFHWGMTKEQTQQLGESRQEPEAAA